jgi:hypothetical protein
MDWVTGRRVLVVARNDNFGVGDLADNLSRTPELVPAIIGHILRHMVRWAHTPTDDALALGLGPEATWINKTQRIVIHIGVSIKVLRIVRRRDVGIR